MDKMLEREQRQRKLANLFFEMGMDLDLIEKVSGVDKSELIRDRIDNSKDNCFSYTNIDSGFNNRII